jgi:hypothetical protein
MPLTPEEEKRFREEIRRKLEEREKKEIGPRLKKKRKKDILRKRAM